MPLPLSVFALVEAPGKSGGPGLMILVFTSMFVPEPLGVKIVSAMPLYPKKERIEKENNKTRCL